MEELVGEPCEPFRESGGGSFCLSPLRISKPKMGGLSTTERGDRFEGRVHGVFARLLSSGQLGLCAESAQLREKPRYWSSDRESDITFDLSIEVTLPGADDYSLLILIECKDPGRRVPVDDIEEFDDKRRQVNPNAKGIVVSTSGFAEGAVKVARSRGIGLVLLPPEKAVKWVLHRAGGSGAAHVHGQSVLRYLVEGVDGVVGTEFFFASPRRYTASPWHFVRDLVRIEDMPRDQVSRIWPSRPPRPQAVSFLTKGRIEERVDYVLGAVGYDRGPANLSAIVDRAAAKGGLKVQYEAHRPPGERSGILGRITFDPPRITVYREEHAHRGHARFTLAHELGHYLLGHGRYLESEFVDDDDAERFGTDSHGVSLLDRLEFQANYFASCLLMPRKTMALYFLYKANRMGLNLRKRPWLYVDAQPCNLKARDELLRFVCGRLQVSRQAARNRLIGLNLMHED